MQSTRWPYLLLVPLVLALASLHLLRIDGMLIWHDEAFTLVRLFGYEQERLLAQLFDGKIQTVQQLIQFQQAGPESDWWHFFAAIAEHPEHGPLYYLLARLATYLPVEPIVAARGISALSGILVIWASYLLIHKLTNDRLAAWLAALFSASSPLLWLYDHEARQYTLLLLVSLIASIALLKALEKDRLKNWLAYGLCILLGLYCHLLFLPILCAHAIVICARAWQHSKAKHSHDLRLGHWLLTLLFSGILYLPWLWLMLTELSLLTQHTSWMNRDIGAQRILTYWFYHLSRLFLDRNSEELWLVLLALICLTPATFIFIRHAPSKPKLLLACLVLLPILMTILPDLVQGGSRSMHIRYALPAMHALLLIYAWSVAFAWHNRHFSWRATGLILTTTLVLTNILSMRQILTTDTWWTKHFSQQNQLVGTMLNQHQDSLLLATADSVSAGELLSIAHMLSRQVRIQPEQKGIELKIPDGFRYFVILVPSNTLKAALQKSVKQPFTLEPIGGTWQWFEMKLKSATSPDQGKTLEIK